MDFLLPDDDTMELMRKEFAALKKTSHAQAYALSATDCTYADASCEPQQARHSEFLRAILFLYFVKSLGYNTKHGTQIFDSDSGLERLQRVGNVFEQLNNLR